MDDHHLRLRSAPFVLLGAFKRITSGSSCMFLMWSLRVFLTMFPSAVPNDPLVPTAVLGETSSMVGCIASVTSKCPVVTTRHRHKVLYVPVCHHMVKASSALTPLTSVCSLCEVCVSQTFNRKELLIAAIQQH